MNLIQRMFSMVGRKISAAGWITSYMRIGQPIWTQRNYAAMSREGFMKNSVVYRCVKLKAAGAAKIPFIVRDRRSKEEIEDPENPLRKLLHRPNPFQAGAAFWESVYAYRSLNGNSYIEGVVGDDDPAPMGEGRPPDQLYCKRPDCMKVVASKFGTPLAYVYEQNSKTQTWEMDPFNGMGGIIHWKTFHPLDDWYGLSDIEAAAYATDTHNEASVWGKALLQNSGSPSGILQREAQNDAPIVLTETQYRQVKDRMDKEYKGAKNAGMPFLLDGGFKWTQVSLSPREMDWIEGKHVAAREICHALGTPPFLLGIPGDSTYNNYKEARQGLYEDTILPDVDSLCDELNMKLAPLFNDNWEVAYDEDEIPALAPKREAKWTAVQNADWLSVDEKREATGYEPLGTPESEAILIPTSLQPLEGILDAPVLGPDGLPAVDENGDPVEPDEDDPEADDTDKPGDKKPLPFGKKPAVKKPPFPPKKSSAQLARTERKAAETLIRLIERKG